jgi:hypothetical protein
VCGQPCKEFFPRADFQGLSGGVPSLVVDAADQHRELIAKIGRFVDCQSIAQAVQHGTQSLISQVPVGIQILCDFLEPSVGLLDRFVENCETGYAHFPPIELVYEMTRRRLFSAPIGATILQTCCDERCVIVPSMTHGHRSCRASERQHFQCRSACTGPPCFPLKLRRNGGPF